MFMHEGVRSETDPEDPVFGMASVIVKLGQTVTEDFVQSVASETGVTLIKQRGGSNKFTIHGSWDSLVKTRQRLMAKYGENTSSGHLDSPVDPPHTEQSSGPEQIVRKLELCEMYIIREEIDDNTCEGEKDPTGDDKSKQITNMETCVDRNKASGNSRLDGEQLQSLAFLNDSEINDSETNDTSNMDSSDPVQLKLDAPCVKYNKSDELQSTECKFCKKDLQTKNMLYVHLKSKHGMYVCSVCAKTFSQKRYLQTHMKRHTREKEHKCDICGWKFMEKNKLKLHLETHKAVEERNLPYRCSLCNKQFYNKSGLSDHMNTHTGNRPYKCEEADCDATFRHRVGLHRHMITHTREKPFICSICSKSFGFKSKLISHMTIHSGSKRFSCPCGKVYTVSSSLKRHQEVCSEAQAKLNEHNINMADILKPDSVSQVLVTNADLIFMCGNCEQVFDSVEKVQSHPGCLKLDSLPVNDVEGDSSSQDISDPNTPYHQIIICRN